MLMVLVMATAQSKPVTDPVELHWRLFEQRRRALRDRMRRERAKDDSGPDREGGALEGDDGRESYKPAARQP
jgi:hypothetical protein